MKKYMKSKDFIPEKFYNKKQANRNKKEKGILLIFLILNLILLPITTKSISEIKKAPIVNKEDFKSNKIEFNHINLWIENIIKDDIEEVYINKNKGEIIVNSLDKIDDLNFNNFIAINEVNLRNDGKYKLGVTLNE